MSAIKEYFKNEFNLLMFTLEHNDPTDFYISVWQRTKSPIPLLIWRILLLLTSLAIVITSMTFYGLSEFHIGYWFLYLTHWGLSLMVLSTGFGVAVSAKTYISGPIGTDISLPWYVKTFWVLHNISVPVAFLITLFYWTLLYSANFQEEMGKGLDIAIHGINSLIMFLQLISSAHPTRIVHCTHPFLFALVYVFFNLIYYVAGGKDPLGNPWIYPVVHWGEPATASVVVVVTGIVLIFLHFVTIALAAARNAISKLCTRPSEPSDPAELEALRNPPWQSSV
ncbi:hypothetical protein KGM_215656 [Danaus plexippus plexippus]|uniref:Uncharacterized protein n=1 Tax=Danaus plexippus plexippus TaxID=278856 RepID=A0A212EPX0_DANPL|nr:hypothetical protein KGM_215656 [Danaus plexippus plexippus]